VGENKSEVDGYRGLGIKIIFFPKRIAIEEAFYDMRKPT